MKHEVRQQYETAVAELGEAAHVMLVSGVCEETVARWIVGQRNDLRRQYRALTPPGVVLILEANSQKRYGNSLGPCIGQMRSAGKSWADIIDSAARHGDMPLSFPDAS